MCWPFKSIAASYQNKNYCAIDSQPAMQHKNNLDIVNAESYDDSPAIYKYKMLPFGINEQLQVRQDPPLLTAAEDNDLGPRRKKPRIENRRPDGIEDVKGKARGRPKIDDKNEATTNVGVLSFLFA